MSDPFPPNLHDIINPRELKFLENVHPHNVSHVMCHVSHVRCPVPSDRCLFYIYIYFILFYFILFWQSDWVSRWRLCYQRGLHRLVLYYREWLTFILRFRPLHFLVKLQELKSCWIVWWCTGITLAIAVLHLLSKWKKSSIANSTFCDPSYSRSGKKYFATKIEVYDSICILIKCSLVQCTFILL